MVRLPDDCQSRVRPRPGFSLTELVLVFVLMGIGTVLVLPTVSRSLNSLRADRAATLVAADVKLAFSTAARTNKPVRLTLTPAERRYAIKDRASGQVVVERRFDGSAADLMLSSLTGTVTNLDIYPNGLARQTANYTVVVGSHRRMVSLTRTGLVRVTTI